MASLCYYSGSKFSMWRVQENAAAGPQNQVLTPTPTNLEWELYMHAEKLDPELPEQMAK